MLEGSVSAKPEHPADTLAQGAPDHSSRLCESTGCEEANVERLMAHSKNVRSGISGIYRFVAYVLQS